MSAYPGSTNPVNPVNTSLPTYGGNRARAFDWLIVILAIWLFISPWVFGNWANSYAAEASSWNAWIVGVIFFLVALSAIGARIRFGAEWINVIAAIWLFISPWVLGFAGSKPAASWNDWVLGVVVFLLALGAINSVRGSRSGLGTPQTTA